MFKFTTVIIHDRPKSDITYQHLMNNHSSYLEIKQKTLKLFIYRRKMLYFSKYQ